MKKIMITLTLFTGVFSYAAEQPPIGLASNALDNMFANIQEQIADIQKDGPTTEDRVCHRYLLELASLHHLFAQEAPFNPTKRRVASSILGWMKYCRGAGDIDAQ